MGDPSRPADDTVLLNAVLSITLAAKTKLPAGSVMGQDLDHAITTLAELIRRASARNAMQTLPAASAAAVSGSETVLVVEDNETILTLITTALSRLGYHVLAAGDGPSALERYGRSADDIKILVTDVMMP